MMSGSVHDNPILKELAGLAADLVPVFDQRDAASKLICILPANYSPSDVSKPPGNRPWELAGLYFLTSGRVHEALSIFWALYQRMLEAQAAGGRIHKGMPLVWISDCFRQLGFPVHAKRYLMLTLCEDALRESGSVSPDTTGVYFRLVWGQGLSDEDVKRYALRFHELAQDIPQEALFPEALLQRVDNGWLTELPSANEASAYRINPLYVTHLLAKLGDGTGEALDC
jgi:hypothetical protein